MTVSLITVVANLLILVLVAAGLVVVRKNGIHSANAVDRARRSAESAAQSEKDARDIWRGDTKTLEIVQTMPTLWSVWQEQAETQLVRIQAARREIDRSIKRKEQSVQETAEQQTALANNARALQTLIEGQVQIPPHNPPNAGGSRFGSL